MKTFPKNKATKLLIIQTGRETKEKAESPAGEGRSSSSSSQQNLIHTIIRADKTL